MERPGRHLLPDGRLHLAHGPIDLLISADGTAETVAAAFEAAWRRFTPILGELAGELPLLRRPDGDPAGIAARRMVRAVALHRQRHFVTPMAAVAGAVADEVLAAMTAAAPLERAIVNNGGDIALHLAPGATATARIALGDGRSVGAVTLGAADGIGGIATSGRHGRSFSLGLADSVTVLGGCAAAADAAATLIANAVDLPGHPAVARVPAETLDPDSDLAGRLVTTGCGPLTDAETAAALVRGRDEADAMRAAGLLTAAALFLNNQSLTVGAENLRRKEISAP